MTDKRQPWMKFYPTDWQADGELGQCSLAARGLWIELIALMHRSERYGFLLISGILPTTRTLSLLARCDLKTLNSALAELETSRVFSRGEDGVIYSRRMVEDHAKSLKDQKNGKSGGNPNLGSKIAIGVNPPVKPTDNAEDKAQILEARIQSQKEEKQEPPVCPPPPEKPVAKATKNKPRCQLPDEWRPSFEGMKLAMAHGLPFEETFLRFRDYHRSKGSLMASWEAAWGTWCRSPYNKLTAAKAGNLDENTRRLAELAAGFGVDLDSPPATHGGPTIDGELFR